MEKQNVKKEKKKGLSFTSVTSNETRKSIIITINNAITKHANSTCQTPTLIPVSPLPNISFWVSDDEERCGITITRENGKYGWKLEDYLWKPCAYMNGMSCYSVEFDSDETSYLLSILYDCCSKYKYINSLINKK